MAVPALSNCQARVTGGVWFQHLPNLLIASLGSLGSTQAWSLPLWEHSEDTLRLLETEWATQRKEQSTPGKALSEVRLQGRSLYRWKTEAQRG